MIRPLASVIAGTLLCLAITNTVAARDCRDETPLPADVRLIAPAASSWAREGCLGLSSPTLRLAVDVVTHGDHLVPAVRTMIGSPIAVALSPGRVWSEPGDQGMSRASLPFVVMHDLQNHAYNGVATFLFDDTRVSAFHAQRVTPMAATRASDASVVVHVRASSSPVRSTDRRRVADPPSTRPYDAPGTTIVPTYGANVREQARRGLEDHIGLPS